MRLDLIFSPKATLHYFFFTVQYRNNSKLTYVLSYLQRLCALILDSTRGNILLPINREMIQASTHLVSFTPLLLSHFCSFFFPLCLLHANVCPCPTPLHLPTRRYQRGRKEDKDSNPSPYNCAVPSVRCASC